MYTRIMTLLRAAPTWLLTASTIVVIVADEVAKIVPSAAETVTAWSVRVVAVIAGAVSIVRRVTPVLPQDRGLTP